MRLAVYRSGLLTQHTTFTSTSVRLGRLPSCDLVLEGDEVARFHAVIDRALDGRGFELTDLSAGATRLNGEAVAKARLRDGDEIRIGRYRIVIASSSLDRLPAVWSASPQEMAAEPSTGEIAVREVVRNLKAE